VDVRPGNGGVSFGGQRGTPWVLHVGVHVGRGIELQELDLSRGSVSGTGDRSALKYPPAVVRHQVQYPVLISSQRSRLAGNGPKQDA